MKLLILFLFLLNISYLVASDASTDSSVIVTRDAEAEPEDDIMKTGRPSPYQGQNCNCLKARAETAAGRLQKRSFQLCCDIGMSAFNCYYDYKTFCSSSGQIINKPGWGINLGTSNRPQVGEYGGCSDILVLVAIQGSKQ
jgi:hypothetical protein